jgi:hypothetical protein
MTFDRFTSVFVGRVKTAISDLKDDIAAANFGMPSGAYDLGKLQGRITGLEEALQTLEQVYNEQDK